MRLTILTAAIASTTIAGSASATNIQGPVTVAASQCMPGSTGYNYCAFTSRQPLYLGFDVASIFADANVPAGGTFYGAACVQSWTGSALNCTTWTSTTLTGNIDFFYVGFSAVPGASGSPWDYYYSAMYDSSGTAPVLYGNGFE